MSTESNDSAEFVAAVERARKERGHGYRAFAEGLLETGSVRVGVPLPLGTEIRDGGVNFALFSRHATQVWLEIYEKPLHGEPSQVIGLDPTANRTGDIWHVWVEGLAPGTLYGYRVDGPQAPGRGHRFNPHKLLIDPYARAIAGTENWDFQKARGFHRSDEGGGWDADEHDNAAETPKCVITGEHFDWQGDTLLRHPWSDTIIYEIHVRGFTQHASSGVANPGTYRGIIEKIPYLQSLGVTAVEFLPVQAFNPRELTRANPVTGEPLTNYWGYNPAAFMAPEGRYSSAGTSGEQVLEFKQMVHALHAAGIEVILDVVFNHTGEGNHLGPTFSWRGLENSIYYLLEEDRQWYRDFTGTGNTVKADHPVVRDLILDSLRYWVMEMHVDGFRFDLASVLGRDQDGSLLADPPLTERIAEDPILRDVKIIAEAWDAAGAYQVGSFSRDRWAEWNGPYRDTVRRFWRGDAGLVSDLASRLGGSADLYASSGRGPHSSVNYIASHDGFTLNDLVSYNHKHNEANGENNRDGTDANYSNNYGVEGPSDDPLIERTRNRQVRNMLLTLLLSRGVPMLLGGDEFRRTQRGNNNAYCQDNETSWFDWQRREAYDDLVQFTRKAIRLRKQLPMLRAGRSYSSQDVEWFDARGRTVNWHDPNARTLGMHIRDPQGPDLVAVFHAGPESANVLLPHPPTGACWHRVADTARPSPSDLYAIGDAPRLEEVSRYPMAGRSTLVLVSQPET
ncbi:glycogen debranching enzyme GlgX [Longibacter salinarum]|uniref:Glycogen debranching enzyme GlgX n=1 Tax=Longibacter salinarum TaxID=1850348 RepID=A0A2A8D3T1_9BACT|nr:glycogen debranching protein GlgX [Longibacter salinarum]PEN15288.1 glycogen debranching enzyme GlgX [Longibacter salinarum]